MNKRWLFWINGIIILALCLASAPRPAQAVGGVIEVTTTDDDFSANPDTCSLREAVQAVNTGVAFNGCSAGDTIQLVGGETYTLTRSGSNDDSNSTGDLDVSASLTIMSNNGARAIIAGNTGWVDRLIDIQTAGITVTLGSIVLTKGFMPDNRGGAIRNIDATLNLTSVLVYSNTASTGGAGLANLGNGKAIITQSVFQENAATGSGQTGAGLYNTGSLTLTQSAVISNTTRGDGGGIATDGPITLKNVTISGNAAEDNGGGLYIETFTSNGVVLNNVTITNNFADTDMDADGDGGGIQLFTSQPIVFSNSILAENSDHSPSGSVYHDCGTAVALFSAIKSQGYNLFGDWVSGHTNCTFQTTVASDQIGTSAPLNPGLVPLADNGSGRPTHALLGTSLALNAGNPTMPTGSGVTCEATDQRGIARSGGRCDIGAFELKLWLYLPLIQR